ncbi:SpoIIIAH-like family protein [Sporosarcina thermotolerans]|uniref:SpoIIIAH-like family protein n=1 Tax=Sporosarcina thermotolerans TaxID=633404 RepID=A0AAW9A7F3_9BACL|nr:SpoIIIAH-like family protein [Sporosarcina thermotolerans]MDW0117317.1 SpoIIIAH-like family protein [Sporosarcina thermotolerans]WHT47469.1 SpoIIIAH-like family protein [Sporosarcina thermotolerans]
MKANKRTVWFLTLLSLVAVISIYYLKKEAPMDLDAMAIFGDNDKVTVSKPDVESAIKPVYADAMQFEEMRMNLMNERSTEKALLTTKMLDSALSAEDKIAAYEELNELNKQTSAEEMMEIQIRNLGFPDAFVKMEKGKVTVTVIAEDGHSSKMAAEITQYVMTSWENARTVQVEFME